MKLSPTHQLQVFCVLAAAALLGCEAPSSTASEQVAAATTTLTNVVQSDLVTVTDLMTVSNQVVAQTPVVLEQPAASPPGQPSAPAALEQPDGAAAGQSAPGKGAEQSAAKAVELSSRLKEVVKLAQSGVGDEVILAYIQNYPGAFSPTPDEIVYLTDVGLSDVIITALVNHGVQPAPPPATNAAPALAQAQVPNYIPVPAPTYNPEPAYTAPAPTYNPEPQVVYSSPPVVEYVTPPPAVEYDYFYGSLAPYGTWAQVADYGWCWQPTVAVIHHDWRPYCDRGRWLYTDCGWYWQSDYSWGWAPFHYGRWFHHPARGWCWRPDSVWGPAWVSWRYTDAHCGWAPLPPGSHFHQGAGFTYYGAHVSASFGFGLGHDAWVFVPAGHLHEPEVWRHRVPVSEQAHVFHRSRVVNNYIVRNNTVINEGVSRQHVPALPRTEPRKIAVRDLPERPGRSGARPDQLRTEGSQLVVYRPKPPVTTHQVSRGTEGGRTISSQPSSNLAGSSSLTAPNQQGRSEPGRGGFTNGSRSGSVAGGDGAGNGTGIPAQGGRTGGEHRVGGNASPTEVASRTRPQISSPAPAGGPSFQPSGSTPTTSRGPRTPNPVPTPSWNQQPRGTITSAPRAAAETPAAPPRQVYSTPAQTYRQEPPRVASPVAPERYSSAPTPSYPVPRSEPAPPVQNSPPASRSTYSSPEPTRAIPSYSAPPVQSRPTPGPSYSAPAVQPRSVPVPSYSAPVAQPRSVPTPSYSAPSVQSRPAQSAPAVSQPVQRAPQASQGSSGSANRRQQ